MPLLEFDIRTTSLWCSQSLPLALMDLSSTFRCRVHLMNSELVYELGRETRTNLSQLLTQ